MDLLCHPGAERIVITCPACKHTATIPVTDQLRRMERHAFERALRCSECGAGWPWVVVEPPVPSRWNVG